MREKTCEVLRRENATGGSDRSPSPAGRGSRQDAPFRGVGQPVGRDSVEPSNERSEASHASITRGIDQGSTESHPTGVSSLSRWERRSGPARALPVKLSRPFTPQFGGNSG